MNNTSSQTGEPVGFELYGHFKEYVETRIELTRLSMVETSSRAAALATGQLIIGSLLLLFILFAGAALAYFVSEYTGHVYLGFLVAGGIILLATILILLNRKRWIENPVADQIIRNYFESHEDRKN